MAHFFICFQSSRRMKVCSRNSFCWDEYFGFVEHFFSAYGYAISGFWKLLLYFLCCGVRWVFSAKICRQHLIDIAKDFEKEETVIKARRWLWTDDCDFFGTHCAIIEKVIAKTLKAYLLQARKESRNKWRSVRSLNAKIERKRLKIGVSSIIASILFDGRNQQFWK